MGVHCYLAFLALLKWNYLDCGEISKEDIEKKELRNDDEILQTFKSFYGQLADETMKIEILKQNETM